MCGLYHFQRQKIRTDRLQNLLLLNSSETHVFRSLSFIWNLNLALNASTIKKPKDKKNKTRDRNLRRCRIARDIPRTSTSCGLAESTTFLFGAVVYYMYENPQPNAFWNALSPWTAKSYPGHTTIFMAVTSKLGSGQVPALNYRVPCHGKLRKLGRNWPKRTPLLISICKLVYAPCFSLPFPTAGVGRSRL